MNNALNSNLEYLKSHTSDKKTKVIMSVYYSITNYYSKYNNILIEHSLRTPETYSSERNFMLYHGRACCRLCIYASLQVGRPRISFRNYTVASCGDFANNEARC